MKQKRIQVVRPEINIEIIKPVIGWLYFFTILPKLIMVKKLNLAIFDKNHKTFNLKTMYVVCIPKIKVDDST